LLSVSQPDPPPPASHLGSRRSSPLTECARDHCLANRKAAKAEGDGDGDTGGAEAVALAN
jgi:hypothetical protein